MTEVMLTGNGASEKEPLGGISMFATLAIAPAGEFGL
jgi:hypothetical protein